MRNSTLQFVLKIASRCNLDCSYCYVYHRGDDSWRDRPVGMSDTVLDAAIARIRDAVDASGQDAVTVTLHGGEPLTVGLARFREICTRLHAELDHVRLTISLQTNGTLVDDAWIDLFAEQDVDVGISIDGPEDIHDANRVDHRGAGSYHAVSRAARLMHERGRNLNFLTVIPFGADPVAIHRHLVSFEPAGINYLLPDYTHDTIASVREQYGPTPCSDFLIPLFDEYWFNGTMDVRVKIFWDIARILLGAPSTTDLFGNRPLGFAFVETDGRIEGLDVLRVCENGASQTTLNVCESGFDALLDEPGIAAQAIFNAPPVPAGCTGCPEVATCAGGYLPHRYARARGFDQPTVWCADLLALFSHMRVRLGLDTVETQRRREILAETLAS